MSNDSFSSGSSSGPTGQSGNSPGVPGGQPDNVSAAKKRKTCLWILGILLGGGFFLMLVCCGVGLYGVQNYGSVIFEPVRAELNQMAELRSEVGNIESLNMNVFATVEEGESNPEFVILDGKSDQGDIQLSVKMDNSGELQKVFLVLPDGSRKPIDMDKRVGSTTVVPAPTQGGDSEQTPVDAGESNATPLDETERELRELEAELDLT
ncbi:MAG: hypothetical protein ACF8CQ_05500 [Rhodopirellula sp. JB044]|uniref:hypothetical protein n=1 Tax=Rhodopirellula sp. JB044 TaxID=3342844 RepID=UPI00370AD14A